MKKSGSAGKGVPQIVIPASQPAFKKAGIGTSNIRPAEIQRVSGQEVVSTLKRMAGGWDSALENLIAVPQTLFKIQEDSATFYSKSEKFGISAVLDGLESGRLPSPLPEYGICLYSTGGTVNMVLIDQSRNIVIRSRLFSIHDPKPEKDWSVVRESISSALEISEKARKEGGVAVFDGTALIMRNR